MTKSITIAVDAMGGENSPKKVIDGINNVNTEYLCIINADGSMNPKYLSDMLENINYLISNSLK